MNILNMILICSPLIHHDTMNALVATESSYNPYSISIVNGKSLKKQPTTKADAIAILNDLDENNINYSVGIGQINKINFKKYNITGIDLLEPCLNLSIAQDILKECYKNSPNLNVYEALSCYYSGNYQSGFKIEKIGNSYIDRIINNIGEIPIVPNIKRESNFIKQDKKREQLKTNRVIKSISNNIKEIK